MFDDTATRTGRAIEAHRRHAASNGVGLCGQVAMALALDLLDEGTDARVETAIVRPNGRRSVHAWVIVGDEVFDLTLGAGFRGDADEYRREIGVDRGTLTTFTRPALRRVAKRAASEATLGEALWRASHPEALAHATGNLPAATAFTVLPA